jgi:hypothetical protein
MGIVWTLRRRGLGPSLGAGGSLVVAAVCCLLLATALISFRDWPGRSEAAPGGTIAMPALSAPAAKAAGRSASGPSAPAVAAVASPSAATRSASSRPARRGGSPLRSPAARRPAPAGTNPPASSAPVTPVAPVAAPAPEPAPAGLAPAASVPKQPVVVAPPAAPTTGVVEGTVEQVRSRVEEPLPPAVQQPIEPVLDTVQQVTRTVDGVTGQLLPTLP